VSAGTRAPRRGEIWWAFTPGQPDDPHQPWPVLVLSVDARNRATDDLIVIPLFSTGRLGPTRVPIAAGIGGVAHDSVLFCEEITTIDRDFLGPGPLGPVVPESLLAQVVLGVHHALVP
jgi:mRNA-degrading endonuclease toxin of MazEF toxin-antitoxin module